MGLAKLVSALVAAALVVALLAVGGWTLLVSPEPPAPMSAERAPLTPAATAQIPTVRIECVAETCPLVTVRVPGGDVLQYRDMSRGEEVAYYEPELSVVLTDASTVRVTEHGVPRETGEPGAREAFTVRTP
jgi:hypothetical protein